MAAGKSLVIVLSIDSNMPVMELFQLLHMFEADVQAAFSSDRGGGVVGMATVTVPVTLNWLWSVCDIATIIFSNSNQRKKLNTKIQIFWLPVKKISRNPHMVTSLDALARSALEFPLSWEDLSVVS